MQDTPENVVIENEKTDKQKVSWIENCYDWVGAAVIALIVVSIMFSMFFRVVNVDGDSMNNTLKSGERLVLTSAAGTPKHGDIVVIRRENAEPLIKRVIGLPGEKIFINASTGQVFRNNELLNEPYVLGNRTPTPSGADLTYIVPENGIFVMGDNRGDSFDSRNLRDLISMDDVVGVVTYRLSPFESLRNGE